MAEHSGLSQFTVGRSWRQFPLKAHRADTFELSTDPLFIETVYDVFGLHSVDEKLLSAIGAQDTTPRAHELGRPQA
ncbi:hypothetical protein OG381_44930 [Streptomyces sp. NBC_00490]|uniref:hypothetical protein n=1 Tax=Streptomyces sp. NBC_00490 TaxID=2903657 RepID=UPI002E179BF3